MMKKHKIIGEKVSVQGKLHVKLCPVTILSDFYSPTDPARGLICDQAFTPSLNVLSTLQKCTFPPLLRL